MKDLLTELRSYLLPYISHVSFHLFWIMLVQRIFYSWI